MMLLCLNLRDIAIVTVKNVDYHLIIHDISKSDAIHLLKNSAFDDCSIYKMDANKINDKNKLYNYYFDNLVKAKKLQTKSILIYEKKL